MQFVLVAAAFVFSAITFAAEGKLAMQSIEGARFSFSGPVGDRVTRNVDEWLLRAPSANPGMLEMFRVRDRAPTPQLVPWAGEFVGKYLLSAIQALRMSEDPRLRTEVERVIKELIATQADDGYLGPFPQKDRLRGNWDLWGHYHCIEALLMWHEQTSDGPALKAARRAGDLVCNTFLDGKLRVFDAGSHEMNMAIITALGHLYRLTNEARYLAMMREIEKDWERAGDYLRAGLDGREFYATPAPRWESLHDLQGLLELYRITGEKKYRQAFEHHWRSIARSDIHNTGGFSSGEQATGNPYAPGAIETCCTIAWIALSIDMLRLTGDPEIADYLESATFNASLGAQHPTGRWWTYNTPMDGAREASAHTIVFQSRAGTPELNCCSVNGPRALGTLSEWAVMQDGTDIVINTYIPGKYKLPDQTEFEIAGNYPLSTEAEIKFVKPPDKAARLKLRKPAWSNSGRAAYVEQPARDTVKVQFDPSPRIVHGAREMTNRISIFRGPLLLAYDQSLNSFDENAILPTTADHLRGAKVEAVYNAKDPLSHWMRVRLSNDLNLCDFASAGCRGTRYRTWLRTKPMTTRPGGLLIDAPLGAETTQDRGSKVVGRNNAGAVETNGSEMLAFSIEEFPDEDYSIALWVNVLEVPAGRLGQIFSAWTAGGDDPLRLVIDKGKLHARIENPADGSSTEGFSLGTNQWHHIAAVKSGSRLRLYIDGQKRGETSAPATLITNARAIALGGNPRYSGNEFLRAQFSNFKLYARGLSESEIRELAR